MFCLRVNQLKLVRVLPPSNLSVGSSYVGKWHWEQKKTNAAAWQERVEYMSSAVKDEKKDATAGFKEMNWRMILDSLVCAYKEIPWGEVGKAPTPIFWTSMAAAGGFWIPPMSCMVLGYCSFYSLCELTWAALSCSFMGGIRYGVTIGNNLEPNWYNLTVSALPPLVGFFSLAFLPQLCAYPVLLVTLVLSSLHDALQSKLPIWFRSLRLMGVTSAALALLLMFLFKLINLGHS